MYLFNHSWPYEKFGDDIYLNCPFCKTDNVLVPLSKTKYQRALEGIKATIIVPCCRNKISVVRADEDYFWADQPLRDF